MPTRAIVLTGLVLAGLTLPASSPARLSDSAKLTPGGLGRIKVGLTERQVERRLGRRIRIFTIGGSCGTSRIGGGYLLFTDRRLARVSLTTARFATRSGLRIGDAQRAIREQYGRRAKRSPHAYDPDGFYFKVTRGNRRFVFATDGSAITEIRGGRIPEVDYVEGCA